MKNIVYALQERVSKEIMATPTARILKKLSIVVPCHNEGENVRLLYKELAKVCSLHSWQLQLIFVDDSTDDTPSLIEGLNRENPDVCLLRLTRSYGQSMAIFAGLDYAQGDVTVVMDSDLEDPPGAIPDLVREWEKGFDVVLARRKRVGLKLTYRLFQALYYWASRTLSDIEIPSGVGEFRLLDKKVVATLRRFDEKVRFFRGLSIWPGYRVAIVDVTRNERVSGTSQYNFLRASSVAIDGLVSFSYVPLRLIAICGFGLSALAALLTFGYLVWRLVDPRAFGAGWASLFLISVFSMGVNLLFLGVVAEYVGRIFQQVQGRPNYLVDYSLGLKDE